VVEASTRFASVGDTRMRETLLNRMSFSVEASGVQVSPRSVDFRMPLPLMTSTL
jgi:hypothetical protein